MRRYFHRISLVVLSILILIPVFLLGHIRFHSSRSRLPERGEEILRLEGLEDKVGVTIDDRGIPHVEALSEGDLWFVQGYLHARDRFFQMDLVRRRAEGRLSEVFGDSTLQNDRQMRTLRLWAVARRQAAELEGGDRRILERYTAGVNSALEKFGRWIAPEMWALGADPDPWQIEDSLAICVLQHLGVSRAMGDELRRSEELAHFGRAMALELWGWSPQQVRQWIPPVDMPSEKLSGYEPSLSSFGAGSGTWAMSPQRTASGNAILATVSQIGVTLPGTWYVVGLRAPGLHVSGASMAGLPGVLIGHTEKVAWGFTGSGMDDQDLFVLTLDDAGSRELVDGSWLPLRTVTEEISVRWQSDPEILKVKLSRHGPIISEGLGAGLALACTALEDRSSLHAFLAMARAETVEETARAWEDQLGPPLNLVAADVDGHILHQVVGCEPARGHGAGRLPAPGSDSSWAWDGFRSFSDNPRASNPPGGFVATTDHDLFAEGDFPGHRVYPGDFASPWSIRHIRRRLEMRTGWEVEDCLRLQGDVKSGRAIAILKALWPDLERHGGPTAEALLRWDGKMESSRSEPHLYSRFLMELSREIGIDEALGVGREESPIGAGRVLQLLAGAIGDSWWNDIRTERHESREEIVDRCLDRMDALGLRTSWGEVHQVAFHHRLENFPLLGGLFRFIGRRGPFAVGGDDTTVNGHSWRPDEPFAVVAIPSLRFVADVGDWDRSLLILPLGQSGRPWSAHYGDQVADWLSVRGKTLPFSRTAIAEAARAQMTLEPPDSR
ncbi:MAG: penicillin acylase family protein [Thermoanaerobaculales bacterium]|nr:penicillin acylase family protein [Thermoanaerobaculales bacterium]